MTQAIDADLRSRLLQGTKERRSVRSERRWSVLGRCARAATARELLCMPCNRIKQVNRYELIRGTGAHVCFEHGRGYAIGILR